jgi:hypothetical protein
LAKNKLCLGTLLQTGVLREEERGSTALHGVFRVFEKDWNKGKSKQMEDILLLQMTGSHLPQCQSSAQVEKDISPMLEQNTKLLLVTVSDTEEVILAI